MRPFLILVLLATTLAVPAAARPGDPKSIMVRGRTADPEGFPVEKVRVWVEGARGASTLSGVDGHFSLTFPVGTAADLRRGALRLAVRTERKGWRFTAPSGDARLALDLSIEPAEGGAARCVARSNDAGFAAAAARAIAQDEEGAAVATIYFIGVKGDALPNPPWPALDQVARTSLSSGLEPELSTTAPTPPGAATVKPGEPATPDARVESPDAAPPPSTTTPPRTVAPPRASASGRDRPAPERRSPSRDAASMRRWEEAERELKKIRERVARESLEIASRAATRAAKRQARIDQQTRKSAVKTGGNPKGWSILGAPQTASPPDTVGASAVDREPTLEPPAIVAPTPSPTPAPTVKGPKVKPPPKPRGSRERARPLVIRTGSARTESDSCKCRIEGTLEVYSKQPLKGRQRVEVSLQGSPHLSDTVELFMGSPRPFRIPAARCGPQRLRVRVLGDARLVAGPRDVLAGFHCTGDRVHQPRIILRPF